MQWLNLILQILLLHVYLQKMLMAPNPLSSADVKAMRQDAAACFKGKG